MKSKNVRVIDEHNIDRDANVMFALELDGSEYVVYWIARDEESNNVFVSKVLRNIDGTYNMLNIDDEEKKKEIAEIVKVLISSSVSNQNDKLVGTSVSLSNGKVVNIISVSFNKEQHIDVSKTYITTVKKEVTKVAETYYDVVVEVKVEPVLTAAPLTVEPAPAVVEPITQPTVTVVETPVVQPAVASAPVVEDSPVSVIPTPVAATPVVEPSVVGEAAPVDPSVVVPTEVKVETPVVETPAVQPVITPTPVVEVAPASVIPTPVEPVVASTPDTLVFNAAKETNLNAALGEVANSSAIPVENIASVREFGVEAPVAPAPAVETPAVAPIPVATPNAAQPVNAVPTATNKAGFANGKFFMVVAVAFFLASCVFLGYEVYNYFQLVQ